MQRLRHRLCGGCIKCSYPTVRSLEDTLLVVFSCVCTSKCHAHSTAQRSAARSTLIPNANDNDSVCSASVTCASVPCLPALWTGERQPRRGSVCTHSTISIPAMANV